MCGAWSIPLPDPYLHTVSLHCGQALERWITSSPRNAVGVEGIMPFVRICVQESIESLHSHSQPSNSPSFETHFRVLLIPQTSLHLRKHPNWDQVNRRANLSPHPAISCPRRTCGNDGSYGGEMPKGVYTEPWN